MGSSLTFWSIKNRKIKKKQGVPTLLNFEINNKTERKIFNFLYIQRRV